MRSSFLLMVLVGAGGTACAQPVSTRSAMPEANDSPVVHPDGILPALAWVAELQTAEWGTCYRGLPPHGCGPRGTSVRLDLQRRALEVAYRDRVLRWIGDEIVWIERAQPRRPERVFELPTSYSARLDELWTELRAGFPNTAFIQGERPLDAYERTPVESWYRVVLPFDWANAADVFLVVNGDGTPAKLTIRDKITGQPWPADPRFGRDSLDGIGMRPRYRNVPLPDDVYQTAVYRLSATTVWPAPAMPYHEVITRVGLEWGGCGTWRVPNDRLEQWRLSTAAATCPLKFQASISGSRECVPGSWTLLDSSTTPPTVIETALESCGVPTRFDLHIDRDPQALELRFTPERGARCSQPARSPSFDDLPRFSWGGCWPGWDYLGWGMRAGRSKP